MSGSERLILAAVFALYCAVVITGAVVHEPWWDEAQAWLIARDASPVELFTHVVRYEGHPPLWFLILAIPAKLGLPYWTMKVVAALCGATTVLLLLYAFPRVPLYLRVLAPFAFFLAYQYTVVARSYVLLGPLLLGVARMYERRAERFGTFVTLLILMSHVSVHGFAIACALLLIALVERPSVLLSREDDEGPPTEKRRSSFAALAMTRAFALNAVLLMAMLWPPGDGTSHGGLQDVLSPRRHFFVLSSIVPALFWSPLSDESLTAAVVMACAAVAALAILIVWFLRNGVAAPFLLGAAAALFVSARYYAMWHEGIFFLLLLYVIVLAFQRRRAPRSLDAAAQMVIVLLLLRHGQWTAQSLAYDIRNEHTGSALAADFLENRGLDKRVVYGAGVATVELQPYFASNLFDNYRAGHAYWEWSPRNDWPYAAPSPETHRRMAEWFRRNVAEEPEIIVCGTGFLDDRLYAKSLNRFPAYRTIGEFSGETFWKTRPSRFIAFQVFERVDPPRGKPPASAPRSDAR